MIRDGGTLSGVTLVKGQKCGPAAETIIQHV